MTNPSNYTAAYIYYATHTEDECEAPCLYDYITEMDEPTEDDECLSLEALLAEWLIEDETNIPSFHL